MKILYIGYWGANEGLSQSTINPHLEILLQFADVSKVTYVSIERKVQSSYKLPYSEKLIHFPLRGDLYSTRLWNKFREFILFPKKLIAKSKIEMYDLIICRSSLAGVLGLKISEVTKIPFVVESFEPHADYMVEAGIWKRYGISALLQYRWEIKEKHKALAIITVSENYKNKLILEESIDASKIFVNPCAVDQEYFAFDPAARIAIREQLKIDQEVLVAIYVGKFGGIYFDLDLILNLFQGLADVMHNLKIIWLTPQSEELASILKDRGFEDFLWCSCVDHSEVPAYLSASDFAFSLHVPSPSKLFVSPIKNGEYWASGLPIIISDGIGDDSERVKSNPQMGFLIEDSLNMEKLSSEIQQCVNNQLNRDSLLIRNDRSFELIHETYRMLINQMSHFREDEIE